MRMGQVCLEEVSALRGLMPPVEHLHPCHPPIPEPSCAVGNLPEAGIRRGPRGGDEGHFEAWGHGCSLGEEMQERGAGV